MATPGRLARLSLLVLLGACSGKSRTLDGPREAELALIDDMDHDVENFGDDLDFFGWGNGGVGHWWLTIDGVGSEGNIHDIVPPRGESTKGCHITGADLAGGADLFALLDFPRYSSMDVSAYRGLVFFARLEGSTDQLTVALPADGSINLDPASHPTLTLTVSTEWQRFELGFDEFPLPKLSLWSIDFIVGAGGESFDLWIDDLSFICRGSCPRYDAGTPPSGG